MPYLEILSKLSPLVIFLSVVVSVVYVTKQMKMHYFLAQRNKAINYSLYANEHLRESRMKIEKEFGVMGKNKEPIPMEVINKKIAEDDEILSAIMTLLAHWENMALAIHCGIADEEVCFEMVASTLDRHVRVFRNFIDERSEKNGRVYFYLMRLRRSWEERLSNVKISELQPIISINKKSRPWFLSRN